MAISNISIWKTGHRRAEWTEIWYSGVAAEHV